MIADALTGWYNQCLNASTCRKLWRELLTLVHAQHDTAEHLPLFCHSKQKKIGNLPLKWAVGQH